MHSLIWVVSSLGWLHRVALAGLTWVIRAAHSSDSATGAGRLGRLRSGCGWPLRVCCCVPRDIHLCSTRPLVLWALAPAAALAVWGPGLRRTTVPFCPFALPGPGQPRRGKPPLSQGGAGKSCRHCVCTQRSRRRRRDSWDGPARRPPREGADHLGGPADSPGTLTSTSLSTQPNPLPGEARTSLCEEGSNQVCRAVDDGNGGTRAADWGP